MTEDAPHADLVTVTVAEAHRRTGLSKWRLYELAGNGIERKMTGSRSYVLIWESVLEWLRNQPADPSP